MLDSRTSRIFIKEVVERPNRGSLFAWLDHLGMIYTFCDGLGWKYMNKTINLSRKKCNFLSINGRKRASKLVIFDPKLPSCPGSYRVLICRSLYQFFIYFYQKKFESAHLDTFGVISKSLELVAQTNCQKYPKVFINDPKGTVFRIRYS